MTDRSLRREVRNPVLSLQATKRLNKLDADTMEVLRAILADLTTDARARAQASWQKNKGPMAAYWKAVGAYANHMRRAIPAKHVCQSEDGSILLNTEAH